MDDEENRRSLNELARAQTDKTTQLYAEFAKSGVFAQFQTANISLTTRQLGIGSEVFQQALAASRSAQDFLRVTGYDVAAKSFRQYRDADLKRQTEIIQAIRDAQSETAEAWARYRESETTRYRDMLNGLDASRFAALSPADRSAAVRAARDVVQSIDPVEGTFTADAVVISDSPVSSTPGDTEDLIRALDSKFDRLSETDRQIAFLLFYLSIIATVYPSMAPLILGGAAALRILLARLDERASELNGPQDGSDAPDA